MATPLRVTVWNENRHEQIHEAVKKVYPDGMHNVIAAIATGAPFQLRELIDQPRTVQEANPV